MKTDKYKDWEYRFFEGEELSPEEEQLLKQESDDPYFSFLREEKQEKMMMDFDSFLSKIEAAEEKQVEETTPIIPLVTAKPKFGSGLKNYWMAASLVMFMGVLGGYLFVNEENGDFNKPLKSVVKQDTEPVEIEQTTPKDLGSQNIEEPTKHDTEPNISEPTTIETKTPRVNQVATTISKPETSSPAKNNQAKPASKSEVAYNPSYVMINGKPVYNEQEALALTEDAFNYLASNVSQTVDQAQSVK
ncbi:hypothetical protein SAMN05660477_01906 [Soonwooa buanensis]|uniref:Uncharacterized protein n=1 Tax=Soonwooa buanensis TaxID=619805 RepID=A0A1T5FBH5_9FLAO|nr:hypothetical protein [Soonwooa buanensis]SKB93525.1 hypothetical protein SAMN05660477_01906 [Soonwooa buanensis]